MPFFIALTVSNAKYYVIEKDENSSLKLGKSLTKQLIIFSLSEELKDDATEPVYEYMNPTELEVMNDSDKAGEAATRSVYSEVEPRISNKVLQHN